MVIFGLKNLTHNMNLANGKLRKFKGKILSTQKDIYVPEFYPLFTAETDTDIQFMNFVNLTSSEIQMSLQIQYDEQIIDIISINKIIYPGDVLPWRDKISLKRNHKILASCSVDQSIAYIIEGDVVGDPLYKFEDLPSEEDLLIADEY